MASYTVIRTLGEHKRGSVVELNDDDAQPLLDGPRPYLEPAASGEDDDPDGAEGE